MASDLQSVEGQAARDLSAGAGLHRTNGAASGHARPVDSRNSSTWRRDSSHLVCPDIPEAVKSRYAVVKRGFELVLVSVLLVLFAPLILVLGVLVKITSRGPVFYSQTRVGLNGRPFRL